MAILLVDTYNEDKSFGQTDKINIILHNLIKMDLLNRINEELSLLVDSDEWVYSFAPCGKYLSYIKIYKDKKKGEMLFFDNLNDDKTAFINCNKYFDNINMRNEFLENYERMKMFYEINFDAAELSDDPSLLN